VGGVALWRYGERCKSQPGEEDFFLPRALRRGIVRASADVRVSMVVGAALFPSLPTMVTYWTTILTRQGVPSRMTSVLKFEIGGSWRHPTYERSHRIIRWSAVRSSIQDLSPFGSSNDARKKPLVLKFRCLDGLVKVPLGNDPLPARPIDNESWGGGKRGAWRARACAEASIMN